MKEQIRCSWAADSFQDYMDYHDLEWGVPVHEDIKHFEFLILEGAQAGLSWRTILNKREGYRKAFDDFDYNKIANYGNEKVDALLQDPGIVRNKLKIRSAIQNARYFLKVREEFGSFDQYVWSFVNHQVIHGHWETMKKVPATTKESDNLSKDLKKRGFKFVGSTIMYAYMQATGMVNDHTKDCFRYNEIIKGS